MHIVIQAETLTAIDGIFRNSGDMEKTTVLAALSAPAQECRLDIYRLLVQAGTDGLPICATSGNWRSPASGCCPVRQCLPASQLNARHAE